MARDEVKTQVLLLHSEQSTLDTLSARIDGRYTVHCATSGIEALNTLGSTPIHVIISAKDLPGMSGVDALREAKKRSPDTIGILLAKNGDRDIEALVGEKEVFQIVRDLKPDDLGSIIDNATQKMRLMALAESANDQAADPDEMAPEHIVMETSENGSTIISDGTGRMRALNPSRISPEAAAGARAVDVLIMSKDEEFLTTVKDSARGLHNIYTAQTLAEAENALARHTVGVVLIDAAIAATNTEKLAHHLQTKSARLVSIVAGRRDDGDMLMDLINRGRVYRFLLKPVSPGRARLAIEASVKHHLEAPDSAFKVAAVPSKAEAAAPAPPPTAAADSASPALDDIADAFGEDDKSFTETVTGLVANIGERVTGGSSKPAEPETPAPISIDSDEGGSRLPLFAGIGAIAIAILAGGGWFLFSGSDDTPTVVEQTEETPAIEIEAPVQAAEPEPVVEQAPAAVETVDNSEVESLVDSARLARGTGRVYLPEGDNAIDYYTAARALDPDNAAIAGEMAETIAEALAMTEQAMLERRIDDATTAIERVRQADPDNARIPFLAAQLTQFRLRDTLDQARASIRSGRLQSASRALSEARALGIVDTSEIDAIAAELAAARSARRVDDVLAQATQSFDAGNLVTPENDNARYFYELVLESDPRNAAATQGLRAIAAALVIQARDAVDAGRFGEAERLLGEAGALDANSRGLAATTQALDDARAAEAARQAAANAPPENSAQQAEPAASSSEPEIVGISSLNRTRYVAPRYPRAAERRNLSGWVDVVFTVGLDGSVRNAEVRSSEPADVFNASAIRAVERWEFEPVFENGVAVEKRAGVRLMFAIE